jgi:hypothetical protein
MGGSLVFTNIGFVIAYDDGKIGAPMMVVGALSFVGFYIWNIVDAVYVAKIKNMAFRDKTILFHVTPFIYDNLNNQIQFRTTGLRLQLNF